MILLTEGSEQPGDGAARTGNLPDDRATTFRAVQGEPEHYSGEKLLVGAYALVWVVILAWVAGVWRKQRAMIQRLDALEAEIRAAAGRSGRTEDGLRRAEGPRGAP